MADIAPERRVLQRSTPAFENTLSRKTEHNIHVYSVQSPQEISYHIQELEREWGMERAMEAGSAALGLLGVILGAFVSPWFLLITAAVLGLALAHAVNRYSPSACALRNQGLRNQGLRTQQDIDAEIFAMKFMRGELAYLPTNIDRAELAARAISATQAYIAQA